MNYFRNMRMNYYASALISIAIGLVLLFWPGATMAVLCQALAAMLFFAGVVMILTHFARHDGTLLSSTTMVLGIVLAILGAWMFSRPLTFVALIPVIAGVIILCSGLTNLAEAIALSANRYTRSWIAMLLAVLTSVIGLFLILRPISAVSFAVRIIGVFVLFNGISNLWITSRVSHVIKEKDRIVDVDAQEVSSERVDP